MNNRVLVFSPHADDATIFVGGTLAKMAREGKEIYVARVTNDDFDSYGLDSETTLKNNKEEAEAAYAALGAFKTIHMGYKSDHMMINDYGKLREDIVELIREIRPYTVFTFETNIKDEENMDHDIVAKAVYEAMWISAFDLHYPEQIKRGLAPFKVPEKIVFSTNPDETYTPSDISEVLDTKIAALQCHKTPIKNMLHDALLTAESAEMPTEELEAMLEMPLDVLVDAFGRKLANSIGSVCGLEAAEMIKVYPFNLGIFGGDE